MFFQRDALVAFPMQQTRMKRTEPLQHRAAHHFEDHISRDGGNDRMKLHIRRDETAGVAVKKRGLPRQCLFQSLNIGGLRHARGLPHHAHLEENPRILQLLEGLRLRRQNMPRRMVDLLHDIGDRGMSDARPLPWVMVMRPSFSSRCIASRTAGRPTP